MMGMPIPSFQGPEMEASAIGCHAAGDDAAIEFLQVPRRRFFFDNECIGKKTSLVRDEFSLTLQGTNISHRGKRKIIFKSALEWDMLVPRSVFRKLVDRQDDHRFEDSFVVSLLVIHDHLDQTGNLVSVLGRKRPKQNLHLPGWSNVGAVFPSKRSGKNLMMCFFLGSWMVSH